jgi:hypothetical protein
MTFWKHFINERPPNILRYLFLLVIKVKKSFKYLSFRSRFAYYAPKNHCRVTILTVALNSVLFRQSIIEQMPMIESFIILWNVLHVSHALIITLSCVNLMKNFILKFDSAHVQNKDIDGIFDLSQLSCQSRKINKASLCYSSLLVFSTAKLRYNCNGVPIASQSITWKSDDIDRIWIFPESSALLLDVLNSLKNFFS